MPTLRDRILERAATNGSRGVTMGALVEAMIRHGNAVEDVEREIWNLLATRRLTPSGFAARLLRRRDQLGALVERRSYEFLLVPWSPQRDDE
ncbi:MAG: hypothetical protein H6713_11175 [Myxococcales bacterium]|nr:hypothetical protein [Myxococcales bacterium]MCB9750536.1 hypothetical protein [Myxococcales bacterium]